MKSSIEARDFEQCMALGYRPPQQLLTVYEALAPLYETKFKLVSAPASGTKFYIQFINVIVDFGTAATIQIIFGPSGPGRLLQHCA
jgi:hypothetical protein